MLGRRLVRVLFCGLSGPGSSPGWGLNVMFLGRTLDSHSVYAKCTSTLKGLFRRKMIIYFPVKIRSSLLVCQVTHQASAYYTVSVGWNNWEYSVIIPPSIVIAVLGVLWLKIKYVYSPLDGMLVNCRVTPCIKFTSTHYTPRWRDAQNNCTLSPNQIK